MLILNDHRLEAAHPGWLTGKLSDVAGLAFFPLLLLALAESAGGRVGRMPAMRPAMIACTTPTAVVFELVPGAITAYRHGIGFLQGSTIPVEAVTDPTDLIALPAVLMSLVIALGDSPPHPASRLPLRR